MTEIYTPVKNSGKFYKGLFEKNPEIMYIFDPETYKFLEVNDKAIKTYGYTKKEFLSMTLKDIRPAEDIEKLELSVKENKDNFKKRGIWKHIKKNGEQMLVEIKASNIIYNGVKAVLVIPNDVTDIVKKEKEIKKLNKELVDLNKDLKMNLDVTTKLNEELLVNEARLKIAQETGKLGFWESNLLEEIVYCSDEIFEIFDAPKMQCPLPPELLRSRIHKDDIEKFVAASQLTRLNGTPLDLTYRILTRAGNLKILHSKAELKYDVNGKPEKIIGITMNVTEKESTRQELEQYVNKIEIILQSITDVFYVVDKNYNFLFVNKTVEKLTGLTQDKLIGKNVWKVFDDAELYLPKKEFAEALKENKPREFEMDYRGHSFLVYVYPSEIGLAISGSDITEKKKIDAELLDKAKFIREISDNIPGGILQTIYYPDGRVEAPYISAGFEELWGIPIKEVASDVTKRFDAIHPEDIEEVKADILDSVNNLVKLDHQFRYINRKTKEIKWVRAKIVPTKRESGEVVLNGVFIDITESEKYYEDLEKSNERYTYISKAANETIWDWDIKSNVLEVGGAYKEMFGYDLPDNKTNFDFIMSIVHPDDIEEFKKDVDRGMTDYENQFRESYFRLLRNDGETVYVYEKSYKIFDEKTKELLRIIGTLQDVTQRKKAEENLREKVQFIQQVSNNIPGGIFQSVYLPDGSSVMKYASEGFAELWGIPVDDILNKPDIRFTTIHNDDIKRVKNEIENSVKNLTPLDCKYRFVNLVTGKVTWVRSKSMPVKMEDGSVTLTGVIVDVTESEKYYAELEKSNQRYDNISKATNNIIYEIDLVTGEATYGGAFEAMCGYKLNDNSNGDDFDKKVIHPDDFERVNTSKRKLLFDSSKNTWENEYRIKRADGSIKHVYDKAYLMRDEKTKRPLKIFGSAQDITKLKKLEEEREKIITDLVKRNKALEQFTYIVSHNLRAPIANILGISYLLDDKDNDETGRKELHKLILESSSHLDGVIRDMNEILAVKKGLKEDKTEVIFDDIVNEIIESDIDIIKKSKVEISYDFKKAESILSVKSYLHSIFENLITNGIKYRRENSSFVKITSDQDAEYVYLSFEDNGIGIDLVKNSGKIFGLYNRFHLNKEGKGMGLFMVKNQVESLDGEISVESKVNVGTKFFIKFKK